MEIKQIIEKRIKSGYKCPFCRSERVKEVDVVNLSQPIIQPKEMEPDFVPTFSICKFRKNGTPDSHQRCAQFG